MLLLLSLFSTRFKFLVGIYEIYQIDLYEEMFILTPLHSHLDQKEQKEVEYKLETFSSVYKRLTGKDVSFEFTASQ